MRDKIVLIGGGGHCKVVIDAIKSDRESDLEIEGIVDPGLNEGSKVLDVPVIGKDSDLQTIYDNKAKKAFITVGSVGDCAIRKKLYEQAKKIGFSFPVIKHRSAVISQDVEIGDGTFVAASATINTGTTIGKNAIINTSSSIDHDCTIGDFVHIAPGAILSGGVEVSERSHIGTVTKINQNSKIGKDVKVKSGSLVYVDFVGNTIIREVGMTSDGDQLYV